MVSATVAPVTVAMSMSRDPITRERSWSPSAQSKTRACSVAGGTELRRLLVRIGLVRHGPAADLGTGQVLAQPRRPQRRVQLEMERIVRMLVNRGLVHGQHVGHAEPPQGVIAPHDVTQDEPERTSLIVVEVEE